MSYRGSLSQCINQLGLFWSTSQEQFCSILCHVAAKYYTVATDDELDNPIYKPETGDVRLVFRGTRRELAAFMKHPQLDLINDLLNATPPNHNQTGQ